MDVSNIWLDFICIDQNNDDEKIVQVKMMGALFGKARFVFVSLERSLEADEALMDDNLLAA